MNHGVFDPVHPSLETVESDDKHARMRLLGDFHYRDPRGETHITEQGYLTDGASIPRFLWTAVGQPFGIYLRAAIIHDKLCDLADASTTRAERQGKREHADLTFYDACLCCGCDYALAQKLLVGVRIGALLLPWKRRDGGATARGVASPGNPPVGDAEPRTDAELLAIWQAACHQAGLEAPGADPAGGAPAGTRGGLTANPRAFQPLHGPEDLQALDALILAQISQPEP